MLEKIQGLVLKTVKFSDTKMIAHMFTLSHGRQSFVVAMSGSRPSRSQKAFWAPLSFVEFNADIRQGGSQLPKPKDVRFYCNYVDIPYNYMKSCISLFLAEFLSATLRSESSNVPLYRFLETSLQWFDHMTAPADIANFHLVFLMRLTRFIGILPNLEMPEGADERRMPVFDLVSSEYRFSLPPHQHYLSPEESSVMPLLFRIDYSTMRLLRLTRVQRWRILEVVEMYYRLHLPSFPEIKSMSILREVFA